MGGVMRFIGVLTGVLAAVLLAPLSAVALDPSFGLAQLKHSRWTIDDGAPVGIHALAQTRDGFLWIGSDAGLHRFDGVRFESMPALKLKPAHDESVSALMTTGNDDLWIGYQSGRVAVLREGQLVDASPPGSARWIFRLHEDRTGAVWALTGSSGHSVMRYSGGQWINVDAQWGFDGNFSWTMAESADGGIWLANRDEMLVLAAGEERLRQTGIFGTKGKGDNFGLAADAAGRVWLSSAFTGTRRLPDVLRGEREPEALDAIDARSASHSYRRILFDRDGALWGSTYSAGLFRVADPHTLYTGGAPIEEVFTAKDGLSSDRTQTVFEDREGSIWIGTSAGLDRFRPANVRLAKGLPTHSRFGYLLMSARDGSIYAADSDTAYRIAPGGEAVPMLDGLYNPQTLCEGNDGAIWLATKDALFRGEHGRFERVPQPPDRPSFLDCVVTRDGTLWFSRVGGGLIRYENGAWIDTLEDAAQRPPTVSTLIAAHEGGVLAYLRSKALVHIDPPHVRTVWDFADIPGGEITVLHPSGNTVLVASVSGLARYADGRVTPLRRDDPWLKGISGIVESGDGTIWIF